MPQRFLSIKNFEKYQPDHRRQYPWIKLYKDILQDEAFQQLDLMGRYLYFCCLILVSERDNKCSSDVSYLSQRCSIPVSHTHLRQLYSKGFLQASRSTKYRLDKERDKDKDKTEMAIGANEFNSFWECYPRKVGKEAARKAWEKLNGSRPPTSELITVLIIQKNSEQWQRDNGKFIPHAATWLNGKRWEDEAPVNALDVWK